MNIKEKRKARCKLTAEIFTPTSLVNEILDRLTLDSNSSVWEEEKTFIDPACGDGQFLVEVLKRKLEKGHNSIKAISTIYGCDIMSDNIEICKNRLLNLININKEECKKILNKNIVCTPLDKYPNGSLDYLSLDESIIFK